MTKHLFSSYHFHSRVEARLGTIKGHKKFLAHSKKQQRKNGTVHESHYLNYHLQYHALVVQLTLLILLSVLIKKK